MCSPDRVDQVKHLKKIGYNARDTYGLGYSVAEMKEGGYTANDFKMMNFSPVLLVKDYDIQKLTAVWSRIDVVFALTKVFPNVHEIKEKGVKVGELVRYEYPFSELKKEYTDEEILTAGFSVKWLKESGYGLADFKKYKFDIIGLLSCYSISDLKEEYTDKEILSSKLDAKCLKDSGYKPIDLKKHGYGLLAIREAGYQLREIIDAGFSAIELRRALYSVEDLIAENVSNADILKAGFLAADLVKVGFSLYDLVDAEYNVGELHRANYTIDDLLGVNFSLEELAKEYPVSAIKEAGFSGIEILQHVPHVQFEDFDIDDLIECDLSHAELEDCRASLDQNGLKELLSRIRSANETMVKKIRKIIPKDSSSDLKTLKGCGYTLKDLRKLHVHACVLKKSGYTASKLRGAGFTANELRAMPFPDVKRVDYDGDGFDDDPGYYDDEPDRRYYEPWTEEDERYWRPDGPHYDTFVPSSHDGDYCYGDCDCYEDWGVRDSLQKLKESPNDNDLFLEATYSVKELLRAGYPREEISKAKYRPSELRKYGFKPEELREANYSAFSLRMGGYSEDELANAGYDAFELSVTLENISEIRESGIVASSLIREGVPPWILYKSGYSAEELRRAKCTAKQLFSVCEPEELLEAGYSIEQFRPFDLSSLKKETFEKYGIFVPTLRSIGFCVKDFSKSGYTVEDLRKAGYTPRELLWYYSPTEVGSSGFTIQDYRRSGYRVWELMDMGICDKDGNLLRKDQVNSSSPVGNKHSTSNGGRRISGRGLWL